MKRRTFISLMSVMAAAGVLSLAGCSSNTSASTASSTAASASAAAKMLSAVGFSSGSFIPVKFLFSASMFCSSLSSAA